MNRELPPAVHPNALPAHDRQELCWEEPEWLDRVRLGLIYHDNKIYVARPALIFHGEADYSRRAGWSPNLCVT